MLAFCLASTRPTAFVILYFLGCVATRNILRSVLHVVANMLENSLCVSCSFVADETDGRFARKYNQTSTLGAVLDMVTDRYVCQELHGPAQQLSLASSCLTLCRVSTAGLLVLLCTAYPPWLLLFLLLLQLDIASHWFLMYSTLVAGSITHKVCYLSAQCKGVL